MIYSNSVRAHTLIQNLRWSDLSLKTGPGQHRFPVTRTFEALTANSDSTQFRSCQVCTCSWIPPSLPPVSLSFPPYLQIQIAHHQAPQQTRQGRGSQLQAVAAMVYEAAAAVAARDQSQLRSREGRRGGRSRRRQPPEEKEKVVMRCSVFRILGRVLLLSKASASEKK